jgi:L-iditol 2-dehydrogenase
VNVGELPVPEPGPGAVLFRVLRIGLRTDPEKGGVSAHGIAGEVVRVGHEVEDILPGERYAIRTVVGCGECDYCFRSRENLCPRGYHAHGFGEAGAYAELFVVPPAAIAQGCLVHLPEGWDADAGLFLEPLAYCMNGLNQMPIANTVKLVVIGANLTGILCSMVARYRKARRVIVCDPDSKRIDILRGLPLPMPLDAVLGGGDDALARVLAEYPEGVEAVVCALPDPAVIRRAFSLCAIGGHISLMAAPQAGSQAAPVDPLAIARRELHLHGASGANRGDYVEARNMIAEDLVPARDLITRRFGIGELKSAIDLLSDPGQRPLAVCLEVAVAESRERAELQAQAALKERESRPSPAVQEEEEEEPPDYQSGSPFSDAEIAEMARRVREPQFDYGPGSQLGPSGELTPWPELPAEYLRERERERQRRHERDRRDYVGRGGGGGRRGGGGGGGVRRRRPDIPHDLHPPPASRAGAAEAQRARRHRGGRGRGRRQDQPLRQPGAAPGLPGGRAGGERRSPAAAEGFRRPEEAARERDLDRRVPVEEPETAREPVFHEAPPPRDEAREEAREEAPAEPAGSSAKAREEAAPPPPAKREEGKPAPPPARKPRARAPRSPRAPRAPRPAKSAEGEKKSRPPAQRPPKQKRGGTRPAKAPPSSPSSSGGRARRAGSQPARAPGEPGGSSRPRTEPPRDPLASWPDFWEEGKGGKPPKE